VPTFRSKYNIKEMEAKKKKKYMFREGEEVLHKENTSQKLIVERINLKIFEVPSLEDPSKKEKKTKILGIKCHWWEGKNFKTGEFHKSELIPYEIGEGMNYAQVIQWIEENN
jgi:hypothetical protein